jgi:hypothetical protein
MDSKSPVGDANVGVVWSTTMLPAPWRRSIRPSSLSSRNASRAVCREIAKRSHNDFSVGSASPVPNAPLTISPRSASATWR